LSYEDLELYRPRWSTTRKDRSLRVYGSARKCHYATAAL
jgi:hypothetical protein